jgi:hypothetical protein
MCGWMEIPRWWIEHISFWSLFISLTVGVCLFFYLIYPLCGQLAESVLVSWREIFFLCSNIPTRFFLLTLLFFLFQQPHHGWLHEKLRLNTTTGIDETNDLDFLTQATLLIISLLYTGHSFNHLATPCREAAASDYRACEFAAVDRLELGLKIKRLSMHEGDG